MVFLLKHNNNSMLIKIERKKNNYLIFFIYEFNNFNFKDINDIYKFIIFKYVCYFEILWQLKKTYRKK